MTVPLAITLSDGATATLIAAVVAAVVSLFGLWLNGARQERARRREVFAEALAAVVAYQEFPYAIRRRRHDQPGEERVRLSEALRVVQKDLAFHQAWVELEGSPETAEHYRRLVAETCRVAGGYMHDAWNGQPTSEDSEMNITDIDYREIVSPKTAYLVSVQSDLRWAGRFEQALRLSRRSTLLVAGAVLVASVAVLR